MKRLVALFIMRIRLASMRRDIEAHAESAETYSAAARMHRNAVAMLEGEAARIAADIAAMEGCDA